MSAAETMYQFLRHVVASLLVLASMAWLPAHAEDPAALARQMRAVQGTYEKRGCNGSTGGGFFDACRELRQRMEKVRRQLGASAPRNAVVGVAVQDPPRQKQTRKRMRKTEHAVMALGPAMHVPVKGNMIRTMCVRQSDGYFFPTPNSGYNTPDDIAMITAQCALICDTADMVVYKVVNDEMVEKGMVSLIDGQSYEALPSAGKFRRDPAFRRCDMSRYHHRILEIQSHLSPFIGHGVAEGRPQQVALNGTGNMIGFSMTDLRGTIDEPFARKVRVVGGSFYPAP